MNAALTDAFVKNPSNYGGYFLKNYNCNYATLRIAKGKSILYNAHRTGLNSEITGSIAKKSFDANFKLITSENEKVFGKTAIRFVDDKGSSPHSAIFLRKSIDGTEYIFSKDGASNVPTIVPTKTAETTYGTSKREYYNFNQ